MSKCLESTTGAVLAGVLLVLSASLQTSPTVKFAAAGPAPKLSCVTDLSLSSDITQPADFCSSHALVRIYFRRERGKRHARPLGHRYSFVTFSYLVFHWPRPYRADEIFIFRSRNETAIDGGFGCPSMAGGTAQEPLGYSSTRLGEGWGGRGSCVMYTNVAV